MTITAEVICDSLHPYENDRLTTLELTYPRFIHSEFMTHRVLSRNASSSRAIPVEKQIKMIMENPAMPIHWGKAQKGMQAEFENDALIYHGSVSSLDMIDNTFDGVTAESAWLKARDRAVSIAEGFLAAGYHKQVVNRLLEPFSHITVIATGNWNNFLWLRNHPDAQPEIRELARCILEAMNASKPTILGYGEWHLPYITEDERFAVDNIYLGHGDYDTQPVYDEDDLLKMSTARCARVSYLTHDGAAPTFAQDVALFDRLVGSAPLHASPAEHQAKAMEPHFGTYGQIIYPDEHLSGNFAECWTQHRKTLPGENHTRYEELAQ